jgi:pyruvate dehydrogenase E2 component (dihydrolipoamide acetyltransferase)
MATEVTLPELGENLEGGEVVDVNVNVGDVVAEGQTLLEVEAEKSTVEVPAPVAGRVAKISVKKGDKITVGQAICVIEPAAEVEPKADKTTRKSERTEAPESAEQKSQGMGRDGGRPKQTAKSPTQVVEAAPRVAASDGEDRASGDGQENLGASDGVSQPAQSQVSPARTNLPLAGPATRRLARELGVDLSRVSGSARGGRITQDDVKAFVRQNASAPASRGPSAPAPSLPDFERWGPIDRQALDPTRRRTAEHVSLAWSLVPHVTQHDQADITDLEAFRREQDTNGPKLTVTAFALKASASALKQYPQFNCSIDQAAGQLILKRYYHVGVAVDTERGLLVPVLRNVDQKSVRELAQELADLAERARQKKLPVEEMRGGTFTITNLGGIGGTGFSPIVNYPEVAILGLSRARLQPVVRNNEIVPRLVLPLSLSYDHRVIDGADAARFARRIAEMLENPLQMLL